MPFHSFKANIYQLKYPVIKKKGNNNCKHNIDIKTFTNVRTFTYPLRNIY